MVQISRLSCAHYVPSMLSSSTGQGHVVAFNYVANWHDGIDIATYGNPDGTPNEIEDRLPLAIDFS